MARDFEHDGDENRTGRVNPYRSGMKEPPLEGADWGQGDFGYYGSWGNQGNWGNQTYFQGVEGSDEARGGHGSGPNRRVVLERNYARYAGIGPRNYRRADERVWEDINERLTAHPDIDASDIDVTVEDGVVTLNGTVNSRGARRLAEEIIDDIRGIKDIHNKLKTRTEVPAAVL